jgi:hypothetical protein
MIKVLIENNLGENFNLKIKKGKFIKKKLVLISLN